MKQAFSGRGTISTIDAEKYLKPYQGLKLLLLSSRTQLITQNSGLQALSSKESAKNQCVINSVQLLTGCEIKVVSAGKYLKPYQGLKHGHREFMGFCINAGKYLKPYQGLKQRSVDGRTEITLTSRKIPKTLSGIETQTGGFYDRF